MKEAVNQSKSKGSGLIRSSKLAGRIKKNSRILRKDYPAVR